MGSQARDSGMSALESSRHQHWSPGLPQPAAPSAPLHPSLSKKGIVQPMYEIANSTLFDASRSLAFSRLLSIEPFTT